MDKIVEELLQELSLGVDCKPSVEAFLTTLKLLEPQTHWRKRLTKIHSDSPEAREHRRLMAKAIEAGALKDVERFVQQLRIVLSVSIKMTGALAEKSVVGPIPLANIGQVQARALRKLERQLQGRHPALVDIVVKDREKRGRPRKVLSVRRPQEVFNCVERRGISIGSAH